MEEDIVKQSKSSKHSTAHLAPHQWKKGQSGNIMGRPPGYSMKEYARKFLERMTDEERDAWLEGLPKEIVWKMSEGNARQDTDITSNGNTIFTPQERQEADKAIDQLLNGGN